VSIQLSYQDTETYTYTATSPVSQSLSYADTLAYQFQVSRKLAITSTLYELIKRTLVMMYCNYTPLCQSPDYQLWYVPYQPFATLEGAILYFEDGTTMNLPPTSVTVQKVAGGLLYTVNIVMNETKNLVGVGVIVTIMGANTFVTGVRGFLVTLNPGSYSVQIQEYITTPTSIALVPGVPDPITGALLDLLQTCLLNPSGCPQTYSTCGSENLCTSKCLMPAVFINDIYLYGYDNNHNYFMLEALCSYCNANQNVYINLLTDGSLVVNVTITFNVNNLNKVDPLAQYYCVYTTFWYLCTIGRLSYVTAQPQNLSINNPACVGQGQPVTLMLQYVLSPPTM
jgi:hypothetical protein